MKLLKLIANIKNKRGQVGGPMALPIAIIFGLFLIGILVFAFALAGGQMKTATLDPVAIGVINDTLVGVEGFSGFSTTLWIMAGIAALLIIVLLAVGGFLRR